MSLHGDPMGTYPRFLTHSDEIGKGRGTGFNVKLPIPPGTPFGVWRQALAEGLSRIDAFGADALVVSLEVDTSKNDPISFFKLKTADFTHCGADIAKHCFPALFVMEGGYDVEEIGVNAVNVLAGFEGY
ncbi:hypothetical protein [Cribrihabitans pelagius]|uniref:hypothetical protein n=1 Tax=Cribrihabitans pelagius TaxID=1765746 RepID=UPI003B5B692B